MAAALGFALGWVADAAGHGEVTPARVAPASSHLFEFLVPNERDRGDVVALRVAIPSGFVLADVQARPGWASSVTQHLVIWRGGGIPPGHFERFSFLGRAPERPTALTFRVQEQFNDQTVLRYRPVVQVLAGAAATPSVGRDQGARTLGEWALVVAVIAAGVAVVLGFAVLALWVVAPWEKTRAGERQPEEVSLRIEPSARGPAPGSSRSA